MVNHITSPDLLLQLEGKTTRYMVKTHNDTVCKDNLHDIQSCLCEVQWRSKVGIISICIEVLDLEYECF